MCNPFRVVSLLFALTQGVPAYRRPWAMLCNPCGVKTFSISHPHPYETISGRMQIESSPNFRLHSLALPRRSCSVARDANVVHFPATNLLCDIGDIYCSRFVLR
jgi:hypothetical protein